MSTSYKLYVGLSREDIPEPIDGDEVISWVAGQLDSFTVLPTQGFFRGRAENTLVFSIAHDDLSLIIDLAHRLRARLNQEGIGLEYDGNYHRMTEKNDPKIKALSYRPRFYPNYNVRVYSGQRVSRNWCRASDIDVRVFENYEGGGFNFYIFEFTTMDHAKGFAEQFKITGETSLWIEDAKKYIQYVSLPLIVTAAETADTGMCPQPINDKGSMPFHIDK
jgi:hypothetical protein